LSQLFLQRAILVNSRLEACQSRTPVAVAKNNLEALPKLVWGEAHALAERQTVHSEALPVSENVEHARELRRKRAAITDDILFERIAKERSEEAFSEFYDRFSPRVYALLIHILRVEEDAQDLLQEIFILVWNKAPGFLDSKGSVAAWLLSLARNRAVDALRSKHYHAKKLEQSFDFPQDRPDLKNLVDSRSTPEGELTAKEAQLQVQRALKSLNDLQRSVIDLAYFGGLTHVEISDTLRVPMGSVKTYMRQALIKMADVLKPKLEIRNFIADSSNPKT